MTGPVEATILHADLDAFYASVEQLLDPALRGKPMAVGGSVVLAASYEARKFGVKGGMAGWQASKLCPNLLFVGGHFKEYQRLGDAVIDVYKDFTPVVERLSIDEAFLQTKGATHLFGTPAEIAVIIRQRVKQEIGLAVSIGVARTKHLAKVASQVAKPDGLVVVDPDREKEWLAPLPVGLIWGVGPVTQKTLDKVGIRTVGELARTSPDVLQHLLGHELGAKLASLAVNADPRAVAPGRAASSVSSQSALGKAVATPELVRSTLCYLADHVATRLRASQQAGRTVTVRVRYPAMKSVTRSTTLPTATSATLALTEVAVGLAQKALDDHPAEKYITLLSVAVSALCDEPALQLELSLGQDNSAERAAARWSLDRSIDKVRSRYGRDAVDYASVRFAEVGHAPEAFRQLAEHDLT